ncbi:MAG: site-specific DNA-methyltransferase [Deltaproteobacteria bacterium]|uniref:site-specific DNA-methyltransferase n=1 Tax=Desulfobacula sp. TaxID=2593537 RepID=UPI00199D271B|nr:site-specific DNA-methyltransferase [Candidatus Desulfobacula maris]MBL6995089.1 site-specific DNA-methyltransferase [Desulfobacula sp.]
MDKLKMQTPDLTDKNIEQIAALFPNVITETKDENGNLKKAVDFDLLKQILSQNLVEADDERYRMDWPGKKASLLKANTPITKTLRPCREESLNFDTTENLYIEGDNFEALKILQESYLGKVKMIYIDPPFNTGTAMIYHNAFSKSESEYDEEIGAMDEEGGKLFRNTDSNGRFHSDWLSMMYQRLVVSRDLLTNDGFIAIAIDHNELHSLTLISDEIWGEENRIATVTVQHNPKGRNQAVFFSENIEYMLVYAKNIGLAKFNQVAIDEDVIKTFDQTDKNGKYRYESYIRARTVWSRKNKPNNWYPIYVSKDLSKLTTSYNKEYYELYPVTNQGEFSWKNIKSSFEELNKKKGYFLAKKENDKINLYHKYHEQQVLKNLWIDKKYQSEFHGTNLLKNLLNVNVFDFPKSLYLVIDILKLTVSQKDIILDFFSGSATTAHAVMQLNSEDGGNRKFIMVQFPEKTDEKSEAYKAGYKTIAEIGKERIRRSGKKILSELESKSQQLKLGEKPVDTSKLDIGFRVYKTDSTNMKDVFYHPSELKQMTLDDLLSNIKEDRTPEDLLTQVILELGLELSLPIETKKILGNTVYIVQTNALVACFDNNIDFKIVDTIADLKPFKVVFKDASFKDDKDRINVEERFKRLSPETKVTVI